MTIAWAFGQTAQWYLVCSIYFYLFFGEFDHFPHWLGNTAVYSVIIKTSYSCPSSLILNAGCNCFRSIILETCPWTHTILNVLADHQLKSQGLSIILAHLLFFFLRNKVFSHTFLFHPPTHPHEDQSIPACRAFLHSSHPPHSGLPRAHLSNGKLTARTITVYQLPLSCRALSGPC